MATHQFPQYPDLLPPDTPSGDAMRQATPERVRDKGYYDIPFLKRPPWGWEIAAYFSCEGISAGAYVLSSMAELFGGERYRELVRTARYLAFLFIVPAPPLLIADLGRPERFHHMLRVFKPISPMNAGAWALSAYSLPLTLLAAQQAAQDRLPFTGLVPGVFDKLSPRVIAMAGLPGAMTMISYPGVLLSTTSTPMWTRTRLLGALISCSSMNMAAAAVSLALHWSRRNAHSLRVLHRIERITDICEAGALAGYLLTSGETARPLISGKYKKQFWLGAIACGIILPALLPSRGKNNRAAGAVRSLLTLAGGVALKWALVQAGKDSALDPHANRYATKPSRSAPGWGA